jgi:hypothetical protein
VGVTIDLGIDIRNVRQFLSSETKGTKRTQPGDATVDSQKDTTISCFTRESRERYHLPDINYCMSFTCFLSFFYIHGRSFCAHMIILLSTSISSITLASTSQ